MLVTFQGTFFIPQSGLQSTQLSVLFIEEKYKAY